MHTVGENVGTLNYRVTFEWFITRLDPRSRFRVNNFQYKVESYQFWFLGLIDKVDEVDKVDKVNKAAQVDQLDQAEIN